MLLSLLVVQGQVLLDDLHHGFAGDSDDAVHWLNHPGHQLYGVDQLAGVSAGDAQQGLRVLQVDFAPEMLFLILCRCFQNLLQILPREVLQYINLATRE